MGFLLALVLMVHSLFGVNERGWYLATEAEVGRYNEEQCRLASVVAIQRTDPVLPVEPNSNVAAFSLFLNGKIFFCSDKDTSYVFCSSDECSKKNKVDSKRQYYKMISGFYDQQHFLGYQEMLLGKTFTSEGLNREKSEYAEHFLKVLRKQCTDVFTLISGCYRGIEINMGTAKQSEKSDCPPLIDDLVSVFLATAKKSGEVERAYKTYQSKLKQLFHSEQRILYYLLKEDGKWFLEILRQQKEAMEEKSGDASKTIEVVLHLHTHKDPCAICGPVLAFAKPYLRTLIQQVFGEDAKFQLVVSCTEVRDQLLVEEKMVDAKFFDERNQALKLESLKPYLSELQGFRPEIIKQDWLDRKNDYDKSQGEANEHYFEEHYPLLILSKTALSALRKK